MPHSPEDKKRALTRVRRVRGQLDALERALDAGADCAPVLQQLAAVRGAINGLMAEVFESHLRETMLALDAAGRVLELGPDQYDIAAEELRTAIRALEALVGRIDVETLLDEIFASFCLGK